MVDLLDVEFHLFENTLLLACSTKLFFVIEEVDKEVYARQWISDLMGDPPCQHSQGGQAISTGQLLLHVLALGDVPGRGEDAANIAAFIFVE